MISVILSKNVHIKECFISDDFWDKAVWIYNFNALIRKRYYVLFLIYCSQIILFIYHFLCFIFYLFNFFFLEWRILIYMNIFVQNDWYHHFFLTDTIRISTYFLIIYPVKIFTLFRFHEYKVYFILVNILYFSNLKRCYCI